MVSREYQRAGPLTATTASGRLLAQRGLPQHHRGTQREADGGHPGVPGGAGPGHRRVDVEHLPIAHRVPAAGPAVPAQIEGHHVGVLGERAGDPSGGRVAGVVGETVYMNQGRDLRNPPGP